MFLPAFYRIDGARTVSTFTFYLLPFTFYLLPFTSYLLPFTFYLFPAPCERGASNLQYFRLFVSGTLSRPKMASPLERRTKTPFFRA